MQRQSLFGLQFISSETISEVAKSILIEKEEIDLSLHLPFVITPNAAQIVEFEKRETALKRILSKAYYILPDGQPIVWLSKLIGKPLKKRLTGSDLFPVLWEAIKKEDKKTYFIVSSDDIKKHLEHEYQNVKVFVPVYFEAKNEDFVDELSLLISEEIQDFKPEFVFLGIGFPKQEILSLKIFEQIKVKMQPIFLLLGASFEFYFQIKKRAPLWMQKSGLEWLYRFMQEPSRMWRRYTIGNIEFLILMLKEIFKSKK